MKSSAAARWGAVAVFGLASTWNYLDRLVLAAAAPRIQAEFPSVKGGYGALVTAFSMAQMIASPLAGWLLDWIGVETGILVAVAMWSVASLLCGFTRTYAQLMGARVLLGAFEAAGIPAANKLNAMYLAPANRAIGAAVTQVGLTIGGVGSVWLVGSFAGWRSPFFVCAVLGFGWIPVWMLVRRLVAPFEAPVSRSVRRAGFELYRDRRLLLLAAANMLWMGIYSLWSNWTTVFLVRGFHLSNQDALWYAWFPPLASTVGAFTGGWISKIAIGRGMTPLRSRVVGALVGAIGCLSTVLAPFSGTPLLATLAISASYFWATAGSVNIYTAAVDIWGSEQAGTAISALVFSYMLLQTGISWPIDLTVQKFGFLPVCAIFGVTPLLAWSLLRRVAFNVPDTP